MAKVETPELMETLRERMADQGALNLEGMNADDLAAAVSHPKAAATIEAMFEIESNSVQAGDPAPDIELVWLGARREGQPQRFSLAAHRGSRPVALIFGSYT